MCIVDRPVFDEFITDEISSCHIFSQSCKDNKRKGEEGESDQATADGPKTKRLNAKPKPVTTVDLIIMNLPFKLEEDAMRSYFATFGELVMVQLKKDLEGNAFSLSCLWLPVVNEIFV